MSDTLWQGPFEDGITHSLLNKFLECRERFRLLVVHGLKDKEEYNTYMEFGNMWHEAEEVFSATNDVRAAIKTAYTYSRVLQVKYPGEDYKINCDYLRLKVLFPIYAAYWAEHPDVRKKEPIFQEVAFKVPYETAFGDRLTLRGKFDAVDRIDKGLYLQENKTKSRIDASAITATIHDNSQTMIYLTALQAMVDRGDLDGPVKGLRYNVVYNSNHMVGGKRTTEADYKAKVLEDESKYFHRWRVEVHPANLQSFRDRILDPILCQLCEWWDWVSSPEGLKDPFANSIHWQTPWGLYNSLAQGWRGSYYEYLTGDKSNVEKIDTLYPELKPN